MEFTNDPVRKSLHLQRLPFSNAYQSQYIIIYSLHQSQYKVSSVDKQNIDTVENIGLAFRQCTFSTISLLSNSKDG